MGNIKLFESKQIRTVWNEPDQKWYFVIADVIQVLTDTSNAKIILQKCVSGINGFRMGGDKLSPPPFG